MFSPLPPVPRKRCCAMCRSWTNQRKSQKKSRTLCVWQRVLLALVCECDVSEPETRWPLQRRTLSSGSELPPITEQSVTLWVLYFAATQCVNCQFQVEGLLLLLFMTFTFATYGLHTSFVLLSVLGVFEVVRGSLLLRDIINVSKLTNPGFFLQSRHFQDNQKGLYGYLALSFINFILRHGYGNSSDVRHWFGSNSGRSFDSIYFFVQLFLFFYEGILFCYVVRFYGNIEVFRNEKKGNDNVNVWIRIFTHYRAVAHAVSVCRLVARASASAVSRRFYTTKIRFSYPIGG